jgi:DNA mismatch repair ATPase MutL
VHPHKTPISAEMMTTAIPMLDLFFALSLSFGVGVGAGAIVAPPAAAVAVIIAVPSFPLLLLLRARSSLVSSTTSRSIFNTSSSTSFVSRFLSLKTSSVAARAFVDSTSPSRRPRRMARLRCSMISRGVRFAAVVVVAVVVVASALAASSGETVTPRLASRPAAAASTTSANPRIARARDTTDRIPPSRPPSPSSLSAVASRVRRAASRHRRPAVALALSFGARLPVTRVDAFHVPLAGVRGDPLRSRRALAVVVAVVVASDVVASFSNDSSARSFARSDAIARARVVSPARGLVERAVDSRASALVGRARVAPCRRTRRRFVASIRFASIHSFARRRPDDDARARSRRRARPRRMLRPLAARDAAAIGANRAGGHVPTLIAALVANAVDARARSIRVDVAMGRCEGAKANVRVVVADDGDGMTREDARELCLALREGREESAGSASGIGGATRGGRNRSGRALVAIAGAVRVLKIISRARGSSEPAMELTHAWDEDGNGDGGARLETSLRAFDEDATTVRLEGVFWNNSVAMKRLSERKTEFVMEMRSIVFHACLLRPNLGITLRVDDAVVERVEGNRSSVLDGLGRAFGDDVVRYLRPVEYDSDDLRVRGYVSAPDRRLGSAELQYVYVNGDFIRGKSNALHREMIRIEADAFLGHGARNIGKGFPAYLISIECPEDAFEVTFDPKTTLIEFENWNTVLSVLRKACVNEHAWPIRDDSPNDDPPPNMNSVVDPPRNRRKMSERGRCECCPNDGEGPFAKSMLRRLSRDTEPPRSPSNAAAALKTWSNPVFDSEVPILSIEKTAASSALRPPPELSRECLLSMSDGEERVRVIDQVGKKFILTVLDDDIIVAFDQHAADERISLEELWARVLSDDVHVPTQETQSSVLWATPVSVEEFNTLNSNAALVRRWGWDWRNDNDDNNETVVYLTRVPTIRGTSLGGDALRQYLFQLQTTSTSTKQAPRPLHRLLASKACRGAIMFGDTLNRDECEAIVRALRLTQMPFACAHGRPTCAPLARVPNRATLERGEKSNLPNIRAWIRARAANKS